MNKTELNAKWGKYINVNQLVDDTINLYSAYNHICTEHGVCTMLDEFFTNKEPFIKLFVTSNNYIGGLRITIKEKFRRDKDIHAISCFCDNFSCDVGARNILLKATDSEGKTITERMDFGKKFISAKDLNKVELKSIAKSHNIAIKQFNPRTGFTNDSETKMSNFSRHMSHFKTMSRELIPNDYQVSDSIVIKKGTKTSRAFNKVCVHYGIDKAENYNKLFARYADMVTDSMRELYFVISINPLDYLTMSMGESWRSCHNIRDGGWKAGCESYMLDSTSIITFIIKDLNGPIHEHGKIYREMFHYNNQNLIQSRIYPAGNDGATDLYDKFREIVQKEFSQLLKIENNWITESGTLNYKNIIHHKGAHYKDLDYHDQCTISHPVGVRKIDIMNIGHDTICIRCGHTDPSIPARSFYHARCDDFSF